MTRTFAFEGREYHRNGGLLLCRDPGIVLGGFTFWDVVTGPEKAMVLNTEAPDAPTNED